jgi:cytochrome c-type biogenesis protein CcmH/NrfG
MKPAIVIFDTLAQCSSGDENSAEEMRPILQNIALIQERLGAAVVLLHHATKNKPKVERGSSSLRAAADVVIRLERKAAAILVDNDKQKDDEASKRLSLRLETVELEGGTPPLSGGESNAVGLTRVQQRVLGALVAFGAPLASGEWQRRVSDDHERPMTKDAFQKHRRYLAENGLVTKAAGHYQPTERGRECIYTVRQSAAACGT